MNEKRAEIILSQLPKNAQKVFTVVPIDEPLSSQTILSLLVDTTNMPHNVVRGCLKTLVEAGLAKEPSNNYYVRAKGLKLQSSLAALVTEAPTPKLGDLMRAATNPAKPIPMPEQTTVATMKSATKKDPIVRLTSITKNLAAVVNSHANQMAAFAAELEDVAEDLQAQKSDNAEAAAKLQLLKDMLK